MSKAAIFGIAGALVSASMFALGYSAGNTSNAGAGPIAAQTAPARSEIEAVIRSYLIENPQILMEMQASRTSEREGRLIDSDQAGSMEKKKQEGYF